MVKVIKYKCPHCEIEIFVTTKNDQIGVVKSCDNCKGLYYRKISHSGEIEVLPFDPKENENSLSKKIEIIEQDGKQKFNTDYSRAETIAILEFWKIKIVNNMLKKESEDYV